MTAKFKAIRYFKGKLSEEEMQNYKESLTRLERRGKKLNEKPARLIEKERRSK